MARNHPLDFLKTPYLLDFTARESANAPALGGGVRLK